MELLEATAYAKAWGRRFIEERKITDKVLCAYIMSIPTLFLRGMYLDLREIADIYIPPPLDQRTEEDDKFEKGRIA